MELSAPWVVEAELFVVFMVEMDEYLKDQWSEVFGDWHKRQIERSIDQPWSYRMAGQV